jgi:hypothetical protein
MIKNLPLEIPFGYGILSLGYSKSDRGVGLCIGLLKHALPDDEESQLMAKEPLVVLSFRTMSDLNRLQEIHKDLAELMETGTVKHLESNIEEAQEDLDHSEEILKS